jgi:hypothetical protein
VLEAVNRLAVLLALTVFLALRKAASVSPKAAVPSDSTLTTVSSWFGIVGGALIVIGAAYVVYQWWRWRDPVRVTFLIPKAKYAEKRFEGAQETEQTPTSLTVGVGRYEVIIQVQEKLDLEILQARFILDEEGQGARPVIREAPPSRFLRETAADYLGRHQYLDWNGELRTSEDFDFPREVLRDDTGVLTRIVETSGPWEGDIVIPLALRGSRFARPAHPRLRFKVDPDADEVPFLQASSQVTAVLSVVRTQPYGGEARHTIFSLGVENLKAAPIKHVSINFRVPNIALELYPCDLGGNRKGTDYPIPSSEVLVDADGEPVGDGIFYWSSDDLHFPGRWSTVKCFAVTMPSSAPFPVSVTISSPELHDQLELETMINPDDEPDAPESAHPETL